MEGSTTNLMSYYYELDDALTSVMPDSWEGHARVAAFEKSENLSDEQRLFAIELAERLAKKRTDVSSDAIASAVVNKAEEKF